MSVCGLLILNVAWFIYTTQTNEGDSITPSQYNFRDINLSIWKHKWLWISFTCFGANKSAIEAKAGQPPKKGMVLHVVATDSCSLLILPDWTRKQGKNKLNRRPDEGKHRDYVHEGGRDNLTQVNGLGADNHKKAGNRTNRKWETHKESFKLKQEMKNLKSEQRQIRITKTKSKHKEILRQ